MKRLVVLSAVCVLVALGLVARLAQIQIGQGEFWAAEAARLARAGALDPYRRGTILDVEGRVLARDHATYRLELCYRDFRRNHPLGLVAHARSALEARAVPLPETLARLDGWALELGRLSPRELAAFGRGEALETPSLRVDATQEPRRDRRAQRASDTAFYVGRLLELTRSERSRLRDRLRDREGDPTPILALVARWRGRDVAAAEAELLERLERSRAHLALLAERIDRGREPLRVADLGTAPLDALVAELEGVRSTVEELVASSLFREALGFSAGRIAPQTLYDRIDVAWIARPLYWDDDRVGRWTREARRRWLSWRDHYALPRLLVEFIARGELERDPDRLLDLLGTVHREPPALERALDREPWRGAPLAVFGRFGERLSSAAFAVEEGVLGFAEHRGAPGESRRERWARFLPLVERLDVTDELGLEDPRKVWAVGRLRRALGRPEVLSRRDLELVAGVLVPDEEERFQAALQRAFERALREHDGTEVIAPNGRLAITEERRERALETLRDVLRDYGDRTLALDPHPDYELVYLLTRFPEEYAGFRAVDARVRVRVPVSLPDPPWVAGEVHPAADIVGGVSAIGVEELQRQRRREQRLAELRGRARTDEEDAELGELVGEVLLRSESRGVSGVEGEWDDVLRGRNGYREHRGLEDVYGRGRTSAVLSRREDGEDVRLSLDARMQAAVEWMLEHPEYDPTDPNVDRAWFEEPVGAVVVLDRDGRVVVAASAPNEFTDDPDSERADRSVQLDRTLRKPAFQPPGSVFKPFVAAWALDHLGLDPDVEVECARRGGPAEYGGVRCWLSGGHGYVDLGRALEVSCNCYFAWLGEQYPSELHFRAMAEQFGFGQPSGVRREERAGRSGLFEEHVPELFRRRGLTPHESRLAGNGLAVVEATPMQVARAFLALATGELASVSNVVEVGGRPVELPAPVTVGVSADALDFVRASLGRVTREAAGTAHRVLSLEALGTEVVVKTGSADLVGRDDDRPADAPGPPKHTWVAGWLPPERPVAAFAVFLDRAHATSSHTAVYVARQLLRLPEMRAWLEARGVEYRY